MCAGYGLELSGPNSNTRERPRLAGPISPGDTAEGRALLESWVVARQGRARITGRTARNLNPLIRASSGSSAGAGDGASGGASSGSRELTLGWWWLHVAGAPAKFSAFNSRADRLVASWREPFQHRALLPATWYVEKGVRFALPAGEEFGMAAVTAPVADEQHAGLASYSLVTRDAIDGASAIHDRMPLVLPREFHDEWLDPERAGDPELVRRAILASEAISSELFAIGPDARESVGAGGGARGTGQPRLF